MSNCELRFGSRRCVFSEDMIQQLMISVNMGCQTGWLYWSFVGLNSVCPKWASGSFIGSMVRAAPGQLFAARPLCSVDCCCKCLLWSQSWVGCSSSPGELLDRSVTSVEVSHRIPGSVMGDQCLSEFKNQSGRFMGEASTWGKVRRSQALTQEVPKPVISGEWKKIPRNFCVLLTLFSYFGLCCWQLLEMRQAVTWWGKCSIAVCVQKVSWQMP